MVNVATFKRGAIAPGTLITIFGMRLSSSTAAASSVPLPTTLAGTTVSFNDQPIPLSYMSLGQGNAQLPFRVQKGTVKLTILEFQSMRGSQSDHDIISESSHQGLDFRDASKKNSDRS